MTCSQFTKNNLSRSKFRSALYSYECFTWDLSLEKANLMNQTNRTSFWSKLFTTAVVWFSHFTTCTKFKEVHWSCTLECVDQVHWSLQNCSLSYKRKSEFSNIVHIFLWTPLRDERQNNLLSSPNTTLLEWTNGWEKYIHAPNIKQSLSLLK